MNEELKNELLAMAAADRQVQVALMEAGELGQGYHPQMAEVHRRNAARLREIVAAHGWPGESLVGEDGGEAAWLIVQHATGEPDFMREGLRLLQEAAARGEAPPWQVACLVDRICYLEGKPQLFGTQFDWDEDGNLLPWEVEAPDGVNARRAGIGMGPLEAALEQMRAASQEGPPANLEAYFRDRDEWARQAGWRD